MSSLLNLATSPVHYQSFTVSHTPLGRCLMASLSSEKEKESQHRCLKLVALVISLGAKIPFLPIALKLPLGPLFAACNALGFTKLEYYAGSKVVDDITKKVSQDELALTPSRPSTPCKTATFAVAWIIAAASQLPVALAAVRYNEKTLAPFAGFVMIISGSLFPLRSLQLSLEQSWCKQPIKEMKASLAHLKKKFLTLIRENQKAFLQKEAHAKLDFLEKLSTAPLIDETDLGDYLNILLPQKTVHSEKKTRCMAVLEKGVQGVGWLFTLTYLTAFAMYTFTESKKTIYDHNWTSGCFATSVVLSNYYLTQASISQTALTVFRSITKLFSNNREKSLAQQMRPKVTFALQALGLLIDACALGPTIVIWGNFYKKNKVEQRFFQTSLCAAVFLLLFTSTLDIIDHVVEEVIAQHGTPIEKEVIALSLKYDKLAALIEKISLRSFGEACLELPSELFQPLFNRHHLNREKLHSFLRSNNPSSFPSTTHSLTDLILDVRPSRRKENNLPNSLRKPTPSGEG